MLPELFSHVRSLFRHIAPVVLALVIFGLPVVAQDRTGINGTVTDPSGALIPDVKVELKSPATGLAREARTGATGIYEFPALEKYGMPSIKPIRIIVKSGRVSLEGVVDSEADKNLAGIRANTVPGIFAVTNNLFVAK